MVSACDFHLELDEIDDTIPFLRRGRDGESFAVCLAKCDVDVFMLHSSSCSCELTPVLHSSNN